jgi:ABC-2 type transport system ATP-binding protein
MNVLTIEQLTKRYRRLTAVDNVSLSVDAGEFVGLIGPNGAGKSTTMNCVGGTIVPDEGKVSIAGVDVLQQPVVARRHLGFVPQELELYGYLTGEEYLRFIGEVRDVPGDELDAAIEELLALMELEKARHRVVKEYSGGMARKIAICGALIGAPKLLLLDESFVGLDPESTHRIRRRLQAHCDAGGAIILSSHILDMLQNICTRFVMLVDGGLALDVTRAEFESGLAGSEYGSLLELYLEKAGKLDAV